MIAPADFASDGCTGFVNVWRGIDILPCCRAHDYAWFLHPGDWWVWLTSNARLAQCFAEQGAFELSVPGWLLVSTVGGLLFAGIIKKAKEKRNG